MKTKLLLYLMGSLFIAACDGNIRIQGSSNYENNVTVEHTIISNGDTILDDRKKTHAQGGGDVEINISSDDRKKSNNESSDDKETTDLKAKISCPSGISADEFVNLKQQLTKAFMDQERLGKAKQLFNLRCINSAQVRDITLLFTLDKYKLDFAKFAYGRTTDRINFAKVNDAFQFTKTADQLTKYVNEQ